MKPTKEIINLSKKLHELGYRQEVNYLQWFLDINRAPLNMGDFWSEDIFCWKEEVPLCIQLQEDLNEKFERKTVPIPSLEDGLEWLSERKGFLGLYNGSTKTGWMLESSSERESEDNNVWIPGLSTIANTPHEAVLKAMIQVMEAENENHTS